MLLKGVCIDLLCLRDYISNAVYTSCSRVGLKRYRSSNQVRFDSTTPESSSCPLDSNSLLNAGWKAQALQLAGVRH